VGAGGGGGIGVLVWGGFFLVIPAKIIQLNGKLFLIGIK
jgi:hypothetical protein